MQGRALLWDVCDAFLVIGSRDGFGEEMYRGHEPFSLPFANGPISVIYDDVDFDLQVQVVGSAFLCSVTLNIFRLFI